ncbi:hypothetical protein J2Z79_001820 [Symbiobacterium terraclitae]|uniref:Peptidase MA-like domain-containing protein n=1 Tax=Symbiobacterium terraclitae TaxID=557451 RepID=A0ABS4JVG6_9FIRM|nr:hypothetical protein [Symbiobacterium terraclitae]MBP2018409.1 hypothetical protein [Symbiobacterium terraclitae]
MRRLAIVLLLLLALAPRALADSAPMATAGPGVTPIDSTTVRMAEERIEIHLSRHLSEVPYYTWNAVGEFRIWFRFEPEVDEEMLVGFPLFVIDPEQSIFGGHIQDLRVEVDGQEVPVEIRKSEYGKRNPDADPADWAVYPVSFRAGQPLEMVVSYWMPVFPYGRTHDAPFWVSYVLRTGAYWAGTIGRAEAVVTLDKPIRAEDVRADGRLHGTTPGWTLEDGALRWVWEDVEPDFDLHLVMENPYWPDTDREIRAMLDAGLADRERLLRALSGTWALVGTDTPLRGDLAANVAAEALLPDLTAAVESYLADHPDDVAVRDLYLELLQDSAVGWEYAEPRPVMVLRSEERLAQMLRTAVRFGGDPALPEHLLTWRPWMETALEGHPWQARTQEAIAAFLAAAMPRSFDSTEAAREWVAANAGAALSPAQLDGLLDSALARVAQSEEPGAQAETPPDTSSGDDEGASAEPEEPDGPEGQVGMAVLIVGFCITAGAVGTAVHWARRSALRRTRQSSERIEQVDRE